LVSRAIAESKISDAGWSRFGLWVSIVLSTFQATDWRNRSRNSSRFIVSRTRMDSAFKAHVGEWGHADSVWRAVAELELDEVQRGIAAAKSPAAMRFLADNRVRLNICPTSNLMLSRVEYLASHPIRKLFDAGVRVTIKTDDMIMFGQSVSHEFLNLYRGRVPKTRKSWIAFARMGS
jgi:adenosine deaminase